MEKYQDQESRTVSYGELARAYKVMCIALTDELKNPRTYLMKYLDGQSLPLGINAISVNVNNNIWWDRWPVSTIRKLEMLIGPHGQTIAKIWLTNLSEEPRTMELRNEPIKTKST